MARPRRAATIPRRCAPSSACARWRLTTARRPRRCSTPTRPALRVSSRLHVRASERRTAGSGSQLAGKGPMAGHSKFKNIMYRKGAQDKKRSAMFSKLSREITVAAKMGLPDPDMNPRLRAAVNAASAQSMPKDNIQRSIDKASGGDAENYEEIRYEGFGPGGVSPGGRGADRQPQPHRHQRAHRFLQEWRQSRRLGLGHPRLRAARPDRISGLRPAIAERCSRRRSRRAPRTSNRTRTGHEIWTAQSTICTESPARSRTALGRGRERQARLAPADLGRGRRRRCRAAAQAGRHARGG